MPAAFLIYVPLKLASVKTLWALEPIGGTPVLARLVKRLRKWPPEDFLIRVLAHEGWGAERLKAALPDLEDQIVASPARSRIAAAAQFCRENPATKQILLFPETGLFPDLSRTRDCLDKHRAGKADATKADLPLGLVPLVLERAAVIRLDELGLPEEVGNDPFAAMQKANSLFPRDPQLRFRTLLVKQQELHQPFEAERLPAACLSKDGLFLEAAAKAEAGGEGGSVDDEAYRFKEAVLKLQDEVPPLPNFPAAPAGVVPVLFITPYTGFSGAEESYVQLIRHLDQKRFFPYVVLQKVGETSERLKAAGIPTHVTLTDFTEPSHRHRRFFEGLLKKFGIRLVHTNGDAGLPLAFAAAGAGVPVIGHVRSYLGPRMTPGLQMASRWITVSEAVAKDLRRGNVHPHHVFGIHNGLDLKTASSWDRATERTRTGITENQKVIVVVARIDPQKRLELVLRAMPELIKSCPEALVLLVGESYGDQQGYRHRLEQTIRDGRLGKHVRFWGFEKVIGRVYAMADALLVANEAEPFGRSILEALAAGVPVVAPDTGGHVEILQHDANALLYPARQHLGIVDALLKLVRDSALAKRLADEGRKTAGSLTIEEHVRKVCEVYEGLLKRND
jgi:glycosyltransferase involved in cell wall biosynthesis